MPRIAGILMIAAGIVSADALFALDLRAAGICPPGTYAVPAGKPNKPARCVPGKSPHPTLLASNRPRRSAHARSSKAVKTTLSCAQFNAKFSAFHRSYARKYGPQAFAQDQTAERLKSVIAGQERLKKELGLQSRRSRDVRIRRHLRSQANEVREVIEKERRELAKLQAGNKSSRDKWKSGYKARARALLSKRPRGCEVTAAH